jgi:diacylglycerol kinase
LASFAHAIRGIGLLFWKEPNARIHLVAIVIVISLGIWKSVNQFEWLLLCMAIALVLITELLNTAIEYLADVVSPERSEKIGWVKDLAAGAVLVASLLATLIGGYVFLPYFL